MLLSSGCKFFVAECVCHISYCFVDTTHFLLSVSAKHFREDVSTTVSQTATTGSATLMSAG